ncbi:helix-turn-helix domain-containing protein [Lacticaseibacillus brantae]|uniref:Helicase Helix-turn-helix domain-containing protein n=1 Tax=Lacticaseibacillus brantae DSM 23927 TaxID=1423727 RepID=A0A0R2B0M3_9LACO|nr:helix-turn-helix domain-containing protein [Lacticaseibacillus brantae]KRM72597.1 hypothetical protein FC34_GL000306 [Lacticaseibacillus brantae DSM 23927]
MDDLVLNFFDDLPWRPLSLWGLLTNKKTISNLYAALQHHQLSRLQLYPTLSRENFQATIQQLEHSGLIEVADAGAIRTSAGKKRQQAHFLPSHYQPWMNLFQFEPRLYLGVQVLSEASYANRKYQPVIGDYATQQQVKQWYRRLGSQSGITELTAVFSMLEPAVANRLASLFIGHDFAGTAVLQTVPDQMTHIDDLSQLVALIDQHPEWQALQQLWGGRLPLISLSAARSLAGLNQGLSIPQIAHNSRLRPSTVMEHIQLAALFGANIPVEQLYTAAEQATLTPLQGHNHQTIIESTGLDFFHVRLFQILAVQQRWVLHDN